MLTGHNVTPQFSGVYRAVALAFKGNAAAAGNDSEYRYQNTHGSCLLKNAGEWRLRANDKGFNDAGVQVKCGRGMDRHRFYCGRRIEDAIGGFCGPYTGPQCVPCQRYQADNSAWIASPQTLPFGTHDWSYAEKFGNAKVAVDITSPLHMTLSLGRYALVFCLVMPFPLIRSDFAVFSHRTPEEIRTILEAPSCPAK